MINQELPKIVKLYDQGNTLQVFKITKQLYELNPNNELIKNYYNKSISLPLYYDLKRSEQDKVISIIKYFLK